MKQAAKRVRQSDSKEAGDARSSIAALLHAARDIETRIEEALGQFGLSMAKFGVLDQLALHGEALTLTELADRLSCVRSNITQLIDRLEADGFVRRLADPADRRIIRASLTRLGVERHKAASGAWTEVQRSIEARLPPHDRAVLARVLAALA
jgi:DNA-binding MarR family transcriptional regulator